MPDIPKSWNFLNADPCGIEGDDFAHTSMKAI
jgi:hypothetical protein